MINMENNDENTDKKLNISVVSCSFMCNNCRTGNLVYTGCALYTDPLQYEYKCDNCGRMVYLTEDKEEQILWL